MQITDTLIEVKLIVCLMMSNASSSLQVYKYTAEKNSKIARDGVTLDRSSDVIFEC